MIDVKHVRELVSYDPETGKFLWLERDLKWFQDGKRDRLLQQAAWNNRFSGRPAFTAKTANGYLAGVILRQGILAHRVAWAMSTGAWPECQIDHLNGIRDDNRILNLRSVSATENQRNMKIHKSNSSGVCGVYWSKQTGKWCAQIGLENRMISLGHYTDIADAADARKAAEQRLGFHKNHGRSS